MHAPFAQMLRASNFAASLYSPLLSSALSAATEKAKQRAKTSGTHSRVRNKVITRRSIYIPYYVLDFRTTLDLLSCFTLLVKLLLSLDEEQIHRNLLPM